MYLCVAIHVWMRIICVLKCQQISAEDWYLFSRTKSLFFLLSILCNQEIAHYKLKFNFGPGKIDSSSKVSGMLISASWCVKCAVN